MIEQRSRVPLAQSFEAGVSGMTVGQLIRQWLQPTQDPWHLALVQRDRVWDALRVSRLLDSLLAGYPMGTLLLCRIHVDSMVIGPQRLPIPAPAGSWQLLDGQQRINALVALFTKHPEFGRYYLDMFGRRWWDESIATQRRNRAAATSYIRYRATDDEAETWNRLEGRTRFLRLTGLAGWVGDDDAKIKDKIARVEADMRQPAESDAFPKHYERLRDALRFLREIDDEFMPIEEVMDSQLADLADRTRRLLGVWLREIPVHRTELESEQDILQVFERVNLEGVRVAGDDIFFAAIKTRWPDAEPALRAVTEALPMLDRLDALRLFSRLASLADGQADLLPLRVDRLNPPRGVAIRERLQALTLPVSVPLQRMRVVATALIDDSGLGYGLRIVSRSLFDQVFAWAAVSEHLDSRGLTPPEIADLSGYLLGATVFRYPPTFDDAWSRMALQLALTAGISGRPFPVAEIVAGTRRRWPEARSGQRMIPRLEGDADARQLVNNNYSLFLSLVQRLPFNLPARTREGDALPSGAMREIEWDHIWPSNQQSRFRIVRRLADGGDRVNHAGNFWALDRPLNNFLRDKPPTDKFSFLESPTIQPHMPDRWPIATDGFLENHEVEELLAIQAIVYAAKRTPDEITAAAQRYARHVDQRTTRIFGEVGDRYPLFLKFAASALNTDAADDDEPLGVDPTALAQALGLPAPTTKPPPTPGSFDDTVAAVVSIANEIDLGVDLRQIIDAARSFGFRVVGTYPPRSSVPRWLKFGLPEMPQRPALFWVVPEPARRVLRVVHEVSNLKSLLNLSLEESRSIFGSQRERDYIEGQAEGFIEETLKPLGARLAAIGSSAVE